MYEEIGENEVVYRNLGGNLDNGILSCGFMRKRAPKRSQYNFQIGYYSCFVLLSGSGKYITADGTVYPIGVGDLVQRLPGKTHTTEIVADGNWLEFYISVGRPVYEYLRKLGLIWSDQPVQPLIMEEISVPKFQELLGRMQDNYDGALTDILLQLQEHIIGIHRSILKKKEDRYEIPIEKACQKISSFSDINQDMKEVAAITQMGYEHFRKIFKQVTGKTPKRYYMEEIMKQAEIMLISGLPSKEVARNLGYSDVYSFTKTFKKVTGTTPGNYVKSYRKKTEN